MESIIKAIRYFIHENGDEIAHAKEKFVSATNPLYLAFFLTFVVIGIMFATEMCINILFPDYKKVGIVFIGICIPIIALNMFYARHIFKVVLTGIAYGVARSGVSGLSGGQKFLSQFMSAGFKAMAGVIALFGIPSMINFTWMSATVCICVAMFITFNTISNKLGG